MKPIFEIMQGVPRVIIQKSSQDGFNGTIEMMKWSGSIIVSWGAGWEHVSVSPFKKHVLPSWDDMCYIKNLFWNEDECVIQYHPAKSEYVNNMPNCLHLWKPKYEEIPVPPSIMTGVKPGQSRESIKQEIAALYPIQAAVKQIQSVKYPQKEIADGLEKIHITDRYEAAAYGWSAATRTVYEILKIHGEDEL